ncbi:tyrosine-protein phosphatase [Aquiflexum gelatinilyticum]|uniref:tyrosine-protein phosphatase n=1 Tax=Aquiflexum gelatinilyticum TaxID=2961943 RepID=UPI00216A0AE9|nr:CpsB/CapC family capsule biosynthesis tyrosine phosphatase [Aquiflexum gelatinilyticum]MCS4435509.1 capsular biosynthesis protein [Aquiflexum gelatinilyticum]
MGLFDFLKSKSKALTPNKLDLGWMQTDMHSHLIPGIDDGSKSLEESLEMISRLKDFGVKKVVTTPHIMSEFYKNTPEIILGGLKKVKEALQKESIDIEINAAAEYYLDEFFLEKVRSGEPLLTVYKNHVLVETGFVTKPMMLVEIFFEMEMNGYKPILAHPERYQYLAQDKKLLHEMIDRDIYFQLNLLSLTGFYSRHVQAFAELLVKENRIKYVGTDTHNHRYLDALESLTQSKYYDKIQEISIFNTYL